MDRSLARLTAPDLEAAAMLVADSEAHVRGVIALLAVPDFTGAQLLAYEAGRKTALALLLVEALRPAGGDEHKKTFAAARLLVVGEARTALVEADALRGARHAGMYRPQEASEQDAKEALGIAQSVVVHVVPSVRAALP